MGSWLVDVSRPLLGWGDLVGTVVVATSALTCGGRTTEFDAPQSVTNAAAGGPDASTTLDAAVVPDAAQIPDAASIEDAGALPEVKRRCALTDPTQRVVGSVGGRPVQFEFGGVSQLGFPVRRSSWHVFSGVASQAVLAWGEGDQDGGVQSNAGGLLVLPDESGLGSTFYCASGVEANLTPGEPHSVAAVVLSELSELGRCPGRPVSGEVSICFGDTFHGPCMSSLEVSWTLEDATLSSRNWGGGISNSPPSSASLFGSDLGLLLFSTQADGSLTGWLRIPNGDAGNADTVYCLDGARITDLGSGDYRVSFEKVGSLGVCPGRPIAGEVGFCL